MLADGARGITTLIMPSDTESDQMRSRILVLMKGKGKSMAGLSREAGINETGVKAIMRGKSKNPRVDTLAKIASALGTTVEFLAQGTESSRYATAAPPPPASLVFDDLVTNVRPAPDIELPVVSQMPRDLEVWGSAQGGEEGIFELLPASTFGYVDLIHRPPGLMGLRKAFALYVSGESMTPWKEPGEALYINPERPAQPGNYVVVILRNEEANDTAPMRAMVKRLVRRSASFIEVEQFNPPKTFQLPKIEVVHVWRVMDQAEILGFK